MSVNYIDKSTGDLIRVAGQGKAEYGASTVRKGTINITEIPAAGSKSVFITFDTPMPDSNYEVVVSPDGWVIQATERSFGKTANGFFVNVFNSYGAAQDAVITYYAFKLYTDTDYNNLLNNAVLTSDVTDEVTSGDMNPVTSNAVYDYVANVETITPVAVTGGAAGTITWDGFDVKKLGKLVNITIHGMRHTQDVLEGTDIATGLPKPALGRIYLAGMNYGDDGNPASAHIDEAGNLGIDAGFLRATSILYGSVCYISV